MHVDPTRRVNVFMIMTTPRRMTIMMTAANTMTTMARVITMATTRMMTTLAIMMRLMRMIMTPRTIAMTHDDGDDDYA